VSSTVQTASPRTNRARVRQRHSPETLVSIHEEARRERLLDMESRVRRYRTACFAILALSIALGGSSQIGWWWVVPLAAGFAGFAIADRFMRTSSHPAIWVAGAWAAIPVLLCAAVGHRRVD
jgi:fatty acid desaturase